jgi:predicted Zn-dependent protease
MQFTRSINSCVFILLCLVAIHCVQSSDPGLDLRYAVELSSPSQVAGKRFHWTTLPVKLRYTGCAALGCASSTENAVLRGIKFWQQNATLFGEIQTEFAEPADVVIQYSANLGGATIGTCSASLASTSQNSQYFIVTPITLTIGLAITGYTIKESDFEAVAAHEMGHCLGLWEHSPRSSDLMYAFLGSTPVYSARDLNSLRWLYSQKTDVSTIPSSALGQAASLTGLKILSPPLQFP